MNAIFVRFWQPNSMKPDTSATCLGFNYVAGYLFLVSLASAMWVYCQAEVSSLRLSRLYSRSTHEVPFKGVVQLNSAMSQMRDITLWTVIHQAVRSVTRCVSQRHVSFHYRSGEVFCQSSFPRLMYILPFYLEGYALSSANEISSLNTRYSKFLFI